MSPKEHQNIIKQNIKVAEEKGDFERAKLLRETFKRLLEIELNWTNSMPAQSLAQLCALFHQIEADTKALMAQMDAVNAQAARFSVPVGWESTPENFLAKVSPEEIYLERSVNEMK